MVNSVEMVPLHNMRDVEEEEKEEGHVVVLERVDDKESLQKLESLLFLRVLLVEEDDSSRMIISALLRKCGYQVAAVPDGLKAWEILKGKPNNIDLVLTEVEVPSIAGVSLLGMIMEDDICRRIPVIMMSSQDSVNVVFNCMLRGAVDFLVKPLRKNELRNLWQHVWRRQSLSNSGNSSQNVNPLKRKIEAIDESCSNKCSSDCVAHSKRHKECSEKGSDAQSSCAKPEMEVESANMQIVQNLSHPECRTDLTTNGKKTLEYGECVELNNILLMHEDRAKDKSSNLVPEVGSCNQSNNSTGLDSEEELAGARITTHGQCVASQTDKGDVTIHNETIEDNNEQLKPSREAMDLIGAFDNHSYSYNTSFLEAPLVNGEVHFIPNDGINTCSSTSLLELSLRRPQSCDQEIPPQLGEKNTLNHSNASAFSWYSNRPLQPSFVMSPNFCTEAKECTGISCKHVSNQLFSPSAEIPSRNDSTLNSYSETMSSLISNQSVQGKESDACSQQGTISVPIPVSATRVDSLCSDYGAIFPTLFYTQSGPLPLQSSISANQQKSPITVSSSDQFNHENRDYQQAGCLHGQSVNKATNPITHEQPEKKLESCEGRRHVSNATAQTSSSSLCNSAVSHLNSSGCASDCNGSNGNVTAVTIVGSSAGSGNDKGISFQDGSRGTDSYCFNKREAALTKFRLKRKDRCFDKKVRYQSRKRLAEQRPRVKGQFVRLPA